MHSPVLSGGSRLRPMMKMACLMRMGPKAMRIEIDIDSIVKKCDLVTPSIDCTSKFEDEKALEDPKTPNQRGYPRCESFILAPFLREDSD
eukprot:4216524-Ditylum_brightwellii.AAC.1